MKNIMKLLFAIPLSTVMFVACKKQENKIFYEGGTAPALTSTDISQPMVLDIRTKDEQAVKFLWTNPDYRFSTGVSSQDVIYTLQIDTAGSDFVNPNLGEIAVSKDLSLPLTQGDLNKKLLSMNLNPGTTYNLKARVKSALISSSVPLYSNVINFTVTPYLDAAVNPPGTAPLYADGKLYLVGSATAGGWNNPVPVPTQEFTRIDATHYTLTVSLIGGQEYLLLPVNGDWGSKYGAACGANSCNVATGDSFKAAGDNIKGPSASGTYTITVNFVSGKFAIN
ncbi:MAG: SusE domain-containing protein [Bacteroidota bacterium]